MSFLIGLGVERLRHVRQTDERVHGLGQGASLKPCLGARALEEFLERIDPPSRRALHHAGVRQGRIHNLLHRHTGQSMGALEDTSQFFIVGSVVHHLEMVAQLGLGVLHLRFFVGRVTDRAGSRQGQIGVCTTTDVRGAPGNVRAERRQVRQARSTMASTSAATTPAATSSATEQCAAGRRRDGATVHGRGRADVAGCRRARGGDLAPRVGQGLGLSRRAADARDHRAAHGAHVGLDLVDGRAELPYLLQNPREGWRCLVEDFEDCTNFE